MLIVSYMWYPLAGVKMSGYSYHDGSVTYVCVALT